MHGWNSAGGSRAAAGGRRIAGSQHAVDRLAVEHPVGERRARSAGTPGRPRRLWRRIAGLERRRRRHAGRDDVADGAGDGVRIERAEVAQRAQDVAWSGCRSRGTGVRSSRSRGRWTLGAGDRSALRVRRAAARRPARRPALRTPSQSELLDRQAGRQHPRASDEHGCSRSHGLPPRAPRRHRWLRGRRLDRRQPDLLSATDGRPRPRREPVRDGRARDADSRRRGASALRFTYRSIVMRPAQEADRIRRNVRRWAPAPSGGIPASA